MLSRINIFKIVQDHLKTLRSNNSDSNWISRGDALLFFLSPIIISAILTYKRVKLIDHTTDLITAVSILGGFLFNFLAIVYGLMDKLKTDSQENALKRKFVKEIHVNISFNILLSLVLLLILIIYSYQPKDSCFRLFDYIVSPLIYFFLILFTLTMVMILNRVYIIMKKED
ncbi:hypothetical protein FPZ43_05220 [Mucilaginibacter pallidiroseus]|uniref:Uncharacterized protein n=1 Tax=Mucilaginibacter pallidiroseus TaxID=2599295 RepID=A0A563UGD8_9SPHI|nr:hypothetical protein [Mucilaginibacter pallidiroseus]TWR30343.1 hypothetical protein FPZ43_05220 [Mucilaginibacter pallidiroseus]